MLNLNNQKAIDNLHQNFIKPNIPKIQIGDTVKLGVKIIEGNKERVQFYEGTVIAKKNRHYYHGKKSSSRNWD